MQAIKLLDFWLVLVVEIRLSIDLKSKSFKGGVPSDKRIHSR